MAGFYRKSAQDQRRRFGPRVRHEEPERGGEIYYRLEVELSAE